MGSSYVGNLWTKYKNISLPAKASFWFVVCSVIQKGIAFLTTPIFTRMMTQEEYGIVSIYMSWMSIMTIIVTFELPTGVFNKAMIKYECDKDGYTSSSLILASIITILCFAVYHLFRQPLSGLMGLNTKLVSLMFIDIFFTTAITFWTVRERFDYNYKSVVVFTIISNLIATIVSLLFLIHSEFSKDTARILGLVLPHVVCYALVFIYLIYRGKKIYSKEYWKYSILYNLPLIPHYLSQQILNQSDRIMINNLCGTAEAAVYSLSYQIAIIMNLVINAIHASFMPWTFQKLKSGDIKSIGKRAFQIELLIGVMCVLFSLFAPEFVLILGGAKYYEAVYIIPPVAMSVLFITMYSFFGNIEFYFEKTKMVMIASCLVAILNIILNWIFIRNHGYIAAGYTTLICYIVYAVMHYIFMKWICNENKIINPYGGKEMWITSLIFASVSILISTIYRYTFIRYIVIFLIMIIGLVFLIKNKERILGRD